MTTYADEHHRDRAMVVGFGVSYLLFSSGCSEPVLVTSGTATAP
jgi:hypothetical protein